MRTLIFTLLFFFFVIGPVFAADIIPPISPTQVPIAAQQTNYSLPYPGLLPDNPLYLFKAMRDKLVSVFITDSKKQAEFDLLQADKRLAAAMYLLQGSKKYEQLAYTTIGKGDNYFFYAITSIALSKKQGEDVNGVLDTMEQAAQKHEEVMQSLAIHRNSVFQRNMQHEIQRVKSFAADIASLKQK